MQEFHDYQYELMQLALDEAKKSSECGEVPIGAVIVDGSNKVLAVSGNCSILNCDPSAHAEILVLREAGRKLENYRLLDTTLYVTLEPCIMCMGAIIHARVKKIVFAATDPKTGAVVSKYSIGQDNQLNHNIIVEHGLLASKSSKLLRDFFKKKRNFTSLF
jgi:tRNA(adenine34) deaminase